MFRAFNLKIESMDLSAYRDIGLALYNKEQDRIFRTLENFISHNGIIDASAMEKEWFPQIKADVFISHSHANRELAVCFAGWLYRNFSLKSFIDSSIWGYSDTLLKDIDNRYCLNSDGKHYNYELRNRSTSHVHMILSTALAQMIDSTECLFFLNTPESVKSKDAIETKTGSPWIYSEISISSIVRKRIPERLKKSHSLKLFSKGGELVRLTEGIEMEYTLKDSHLTMMDDGDLTDWETQYNGLHLQSDSPLDALYNNFKIDLSSHE